MGEIIKKEEKEHEIQYYVVKNIEEQYSVWPTYKPIPWGWEAIGGSKNKDACLDYIDKVWTDMRPLSLRRQMEELGREEKEEKKGKEGKKTKYIEPKDKSNPKVKIVKKHKK